MLSIRFSADELHSHESSPIRVSCHDGLYRMIKLIPLLLALVTVQPHPFHYERALIDGNFGQKLDSALMTEGCDGSRCILPVRL